MSQIKKFKDALAKHNPARCSLGPTKGLEEKELLALAANKDLSFTYTPKPVEAEPAPAPAHEEVSVKADEQVVAQESLPSSNRKPLSSQPSTLSEEKTLATAAR